uniref:Uncharacterized protein n=1 Tax=Molossus molossus TaxID=27622 RepID=A0A7J8HCC3_MOLMO|nr:hypothetical protein HJG59_011116 [Molossus molossus]
MHESSSCSVFCPTFGVIFVACVRVCNFGNLSGCLLSSTSCGINLHLADHKNIDGHSCISCPFLIVHLSVLLFSRSFYALRQILTQPVWLSGLSIIPWTERSWFNSQSGHMPGLQESVPGGGLQEAVD